MFGAEDELIVFMASSREKKGWSKLPSLGRKLGFKIVVTYKSKAFPWEFCLPKYKKAYMKKTWMKFIFKVKKMFAFRTLIQAT